MASMTDPQIAGRRHGVPEGRTVRVERMVRTIYPDGTSVDSEPTEVARTNTVTWGSLAGLFARTFGPEGTQTKVFTRKVVVTAEPWTEVVPDDGQGDGQ